MLVAWAAGATASETTRVVAMVAMTLSIFMGIKIRARTAFPFGSVPPT